MSSRGPGRPPLPDDKRRQVRWDITLTIDEHTFLIARYPGDEKSRIISNLIKDVKRLDPEIQRAALTQLREQLSLKEAELREQEDREREEQMQDEQLARDLELEQEAARERAAWRSEHGGDITAYVNQAHADPDADVVAFVESLGPPDEKARDQQVSLIERALERRRKQQK